MAHDDCPVCALYRRLAEVTGLLEDGWAWTNSMGALPPGLGGTIVQARDEVDQALALIGPVSRMVPGPQPAALGRGLVTLRGELAGWLDVGTWAIVAPRARQLRGWAYAVAGVHFTAGR